MLLASPLSLLICMMAESSRQGQGSSRDAQQNHTPSTLKNMGSRGERYDSDSSSSYVSTDEEDEREHRQSLQPGPSGRTGLAQHDVTLAGGSARTERRTSATRFREDRKRVSGFGLGESLQGLSMGFGEGLARDEAGAFSYLQGLGPMNPLVRPSLLQQQEKRGGRQC